MPVNFLPFARRHDISIPAMSSGLLGRARTNFTNLSTGGCVKAHIQDAIIFQGTDWVEGDEYEQFDGGLIRMRYGIYGRQYLTENLYDYRIYQDKHRPHVSVWNWKLPYRLFPGRSMKVRVWPRYYNPTTAQWSNPTYLNYDVRSIMFSGKRVKDDQPILLYGSKMTEGAPSDTNGWMLSGVRLTCPHDSPVDLYSVTNPEWGAWPLDSHAIHILDGNDRPFWDNEHWAHIIDPPISPMNLNLELTPDETITFEFENVYSPTAIPMVVIIRGCLEVKY